MLLKPFPACTWSLSHSHILGVCYHARHLGWRFCITQDSMKETESIHTRIHSKDFFTGLQNSGSWLSSSVRLKCPHLLLETEVWRRGSGKEDAEKAEAHKHKLRPKSMAWNLWYWCWCSHAGAGAPIPERGCESELLMEGSREGRDISHPWGCCFKTLRWIRRAATMHELQKSCCFMSPSQPPNLPVMSLVAHLNHKHTRKEIMGNPVSSTETTLRITKLSCLCSGYPNISELLSWDTFLSLCPTLCLSPNSTSTLISPGMSPTYLTLSLQYQSNIWFLIFYVSTSLSGLTAP